MVLAVLTACTSDAPSTLEQADRALADLRSGQITLTFTATAGADGDTTEPVGFAVEGSYDMEGGSTFPILDLTYTRLLAGDEQALQVRSDGEHLLVTIDGETTEVAAEQAGPLRKSDDRDAGVVEGLGIAGWIDDPEEADGPEIEGRPTRKVTGPADPADLLSDLAALTAQLTGEDAVEPLDEEAAERVRSVLRASEVEVLVDEDDVPRAVHADLDFGAEVPADLAAALGQFAGATISIDLTISNPNEPVAPPDLEA
jgi:hypothetical protein